MRQITRINHAGLRVRDLGLSRAFYEKLGFEFLGGPIGPEPVAIVEHPSGVNINFILNSTEGASPNNLLMDETEKHTGFTHIALEITDVVAVKEWSLPLAIGHWQSRSRPLLRRWPCW